MTFLRRILYRLFSRQTNLRVRQVRRWLDLCACAEIVVTEYSKKKYFVNTTWERYGVLAQYQDPNVQVFCAKVRRRIVATTAVILSKDSLPSDNIFPEVDRYRKFGGVVEIGNLASDRSLGYGLDVLEPLLSAVILSLISQHQNGGAKNVVITVNPSHARYYQKVGFQFITEEGQKDHRQHPKVQKAPAVGMVLRLDQTFAPYLERNLTEHKNLLSYL